MSVALPQQPYDTPGRRTAIYDQIQEQLAGIPGVTAASIGSVPPGAGGELQRAVVADRTAGAGDAGRSVVTVRVADNYFQSIGVPVVSGRAFANGDGSTGHDVAVVNQRFVDVFFPHEQPLDKLIRLEPQHGSQSPWMRIVGIVPTVRQRFAGVLPDPVVYVPLRAAPPPVATILVRSTGDRTATVAAARERVRRLDPNLPLFRIMPLERALDMARWNGRLSNRLLEGVGLVALLLAMVGVYGVAAYAVGQRWKEFGIRVALGATPRRVSALVLRGLARPLVSGLVMGGLLTVGLDRVLSDPEGPQRLTDAPVLVPVTMLMLIVALLASYAPANRAGRVDPVISLKAE
jgi:hypothetical protein